MPTAITGATNASHLKCASDEYTTPAMPKSIAPHALIKIPSSRLSRAQSIS
jgi:hypothetical protein